MDDQPHIVVVEDEAAQRGLLVDYLSRRGYRVSGVDSGKGLRQLVKRELPSLVMLDVGLPGEDGFALARWLRERSSRVGILPWLPLRRIRWTGSWGSRPARGRVYRQAIEPRELLARIKSVLRRQALEVGNAAPRRLAAILVADVAGYSRLVSDEEERT